jgi:hypothetical protein
LVRVPKKGLETGESVSVCADGVVQVLLLQIWPALQVFPHVPQLLGSLVKSWQVPEQFVAPGVHVVAQVDETQLLPVEQAFPHVPQLLGSCWRLTQPPPQLV